MATNRGLLDNPNAASQVASGVTQGGTATPAPQQGQPMQTTSATQPSTNVPKPGQAGTGNQVGPTGQQVVPKPGNKPLMIKDSVQEYEDAFGFDPATMTVEGRLAGLLDSDNKLVQRARDRASNEAAARGLRNSSIAVQAGEEAAYDAAMPIAQADAQNALAVRTAAFGAAVEDQMLQKQHGFDLEKIDLEYQNNRGLAEQMFGFNTQLADQSHGHAMEQGKQAGQFQLAAASIGANAQVTSSRINAQAAKDNAQLAADAAMERQLAGQEFQSGERQAGQEFTREQTSATQAFQSSERRASETFQTMTEQERQRWQGQQNDAARAVQELQISSTLKQQTMTNIANIQASAASAAAQILASGQRGASKEADRIYAQAQEDIKHQEALARASQGINV